MKYIILLTLAIMLSGCYSKLKVRVDVFDTKALNESYERKLLIRMEFEDELRSKIDGNYLSVMRANSLYVFQNLLANYKKVEAGSAALIIDQISSKYIEKESIYRSSMMKILSYRENDKGLPNDDYANLKTSYYMAKDDFLAFIKAAGDEILSMTESGAKLQLEKVRDNVIKLETEYGGSISEDRMASFIVKAPERYWSKYDTKVDDLSKDINEKKGKRSARINKTVATTHFGNADIAIKMDQPGYFVIKGVRVDADAAIKASFKVLNQGIKYMAMASGIPVKGPETKTEPILLPEIANLEQNKNKSAYVNKIYTVATEAFLSVLINESKNLDNVNEKAASIARIKKAYDIYKQQLPKSQ
ncbi:MAG: hypothetical protein ACXVPN_00400 [Bacteroidia bacterium]